MLISGKVSITGLNPLPLFMGSVLFIFLCYPVSLFVLDQDFFVIKYIFHFHLHFLLTMKLKKKNSRNYCKQFIRRYRHKQV